MTTQDQRAAFEAQIELPPLPKPEYARYRKAPEYRLGQEEWRVMSPSLARFLQDETKLKNNNPGEENDIHYGEVDQVEFLITEAQAQNYARAAIEHDRKRRGEQVAWPKNPQEIRDFIDVHFISMTGGDVPSEGDKYLVTAHDLLSAFSWWADFAPQPAEQDHPERHLDMVEPVKYPANKVGFELWAQSHGDLPLDPWDGKANHSWSPATYRHNLTEIAWRAWANKPEATSEPVKVPSAISKLIDRIEQSAPMDVAGRGKYLHDLRALLARYGSKS